MSFRAPSFMISTGLALLAIAVITAIYNVIFIPRQNIMAFLVIFVVSAVILCVIYGRFHRQLNLLPAKQWLLLLVGGALILRIATAIAPISLSDDVYRYAWDGHLVTQGLNPYLSRPDDVDIQSDRELIRLYPELNSSAHFTVYPPLAQAVFSISAHVNAISSITTETAIRMLFLCIDFVTIVLLMVLLKIFNRPQSWSIFYAWNPFVVWEIGAGIHTEALLLPFVLWMIYATYRKQTLALGIAIGLGALAKFTILLITPLLGWYILIQRGLVQTSKAALTAIFVIIGGYLPFWHSDILQNHAESLALYAGTFSFNAPIYYIFRFLCGYREGITEPVDNIVLPILSGVSVLIIIGLTLWQNGHPRRLTTGLTLSLGTHLLLSTVFHPWYLLPVLICAILSGHRSFVLLSLLVPITYVFYHPEIQTELIIIMAIQFIPFSIFFGREIIAPIIDHILRVRGERKFNAFSKFLQPGDSILDIGAGEGYVGLAASHAGYDVVLFDTGTQNRTDLLWQTGDAHDMPWPDKSFDVGILSYVLHHCAHPDTVLREASRVCRRLIILESTYESSRDKTILTFMDHNANRLRGMAPEPLQFDTPDGWKKRFERIGFIIRHFSWLGKFGHKHICFVLDSPPDISYDKSTHKTPNELAG